MRLYNSLYKEAKPMLINMKSPIHDSVEKSLILTLKIESQGKK